MRIAGQYFPPSLLLADEANDPEAVAAALHVCLEVSLGLFLHWCMEAAVTASRMIFHHQVPYMRI